MIIIQYGTGNFAGCSCISVLDGLKQRLMQVVAHREMSNAGWCSFGKEIADDYRKAFVKIS